MCDAAITWWKSEQYELLEYQYTNLKDALSVISFSLGGRTPSLNTLQFEGKQQFISLGGSMVAVLRYQSFQRLK